MIFVVLNFLAILANAAEPEIFQIQTLDGFCATVSQIDHQQVQADKCGADGRQSFIFDKKDDGSYYIKSEQRKQCLSFSGGNTKAIVVEMKCDKTTDPAGNQIWTMEDSKLQGKLLRNKFSNMCLTFRGLMVYQQDCLSDSKDQSVVLKKVAKRTTASKK